MIEIDKIIRSKRKTVAIEITKEGKVIVRAGLRTPKSFIEKTIKEHEEWITEKKNLAKEREDAFKKRSLVEGAEFLYLGDIFKLHISEKAKKVEFVGQNLIVPSYKKEKGQEQIISFYKKSALEYFKKRTDELCIEYGFSYEKIKITSALTRWGSCSSKKTISFTWRLLMAPKEMIDYVILHELCHTRYMDHSNNFWNCVKLYMPDYSLKKDWFKKNSSLLRKDFF